MARRKGEQPVVHPPVTWSEDGHIARLIRDGSRWLDAWAYQQAMPLDRLSKRSRLPYDRLLEISRGAAPTDAEVNALVGPLNTDVDTLRTSIEMSRALRGPVEQ